MGSLVSFFFFLRFSVRKKEERDFVRLSGKIEERKGKRQTLFFFQLGRCRTFVFFGACRFPFHPDARLFVRLHPMNHCSINHTIPYRRWSSAPSCVWIPPIPNHTICMDDCQKKSACLFGVNRLIGWLFACSHPTPSLLPTCNSG